LICCRS